MRVKVKGNRFWSKVDRFMTSKPMVIVNVVISIILGVEATRIVWGANPLLAIIVALLFINDVLETLLDW